MQIFCQNLPFLEGYSSEAAENWIVKLETAGEKQPIRAQDQSKNKLKQK